MKEELLKKIDDNKKTFELGKKKLKDNNEEVQNYFKSMLTYSVNALAGSELTLDETKEVIEKGELIKGKSIRDYYIAEGFAQTFDYFSKSYKKAFTEASIKRLHTKLYGKINDKKGGKYRDLQVYLSDFKYMPPSGEDVPELMKHFIGQIQCSENILHPVEFAVMCHRRVLEMQPFWDGNIQIALIITNMILLKEGYGYLVISPDKKDEYYDAFIKSQNKEKTDIDTMINLMAECLIESQEMTLKVAGIQ